MAADAGAKTNDRGPDRVEAAPKSDGVATAVREQNTGGGKADLWKPGAGPQIEGNRMAALDWKGTAHISNPQPIYDAAMGSAVPPPPKDAARPGDTQPGAPAAQGDAGPKTNDQVKQLLEKNPELAAQYSTMQKNIEKMDPKARETASKGLDDFMARGVDGPHSASAPKLDAAKMTDALKNLNHAEGLDAAHLSSLMGSDKSPDGFKKSEREMNRDIMVAQALRNLGDSSGVHQTGHQTCLLDGKIGDQIRHSPDAYTKVMDQAISTGHVQLGGQDVKLNSSFMRPDAAAWNSTGGRDGEGMSADVRMMTGVYANALTQPKGLEFRMSADGTGARGPNDTGDRLVDMRSGQALKVGQDGSPTFNGTGKYVDSPNVGLEDSARLNRMTGDGGIVASNARVWGAPQGADAKNFVNIENVGDLQRAMAQHGSVQAGLNAHILFGQDSGIGADKGGHVTSITAMGVGPDGKPMCYVQDSNNGTSGWYSADRLVAAIKSDHSFGNQARPGEDAPIITGHRGGQKAALEGPASAQPTTPESPAQGPGSYDRPGSGRSGGERGGYDRPSGGTEPFTPTENTTLHPRGMADSTEKRDNVNQNAKRETDDEKHQREHDQKDQDEKQRAAMWQMLMKQEKDRLDKEEAERRKNGQ